MSDNFFGGFAVGFVLHAIFGVLTTLALIASILVTIFVLFAGLAAGWLWLWALFGVLAVITAANFAIMGTNMFKHF